MAKRLITELFDHYHQGLIHSLPMKNRVFLSQLKQHDLLPEYVGTTLESLKTSAERASYFLDNAIKPTLSNNHPDNSFAKLLNVTAKSTFEQVAELAEKIKADLIVDSGLYLSKYLINICSHWENFSQINQITINSQQIHHPKFTLKFPVIKIC